MKSLLWVCLFFSAIVLVTCSGAANGTQAGIASDTTSTAGQQHIERSITSPFPAEPALPEIFGIEPLELSIDGGTIIIKGRKFLPKKSIVVYVGGVAAELVDVSPNEIIAIAPPAPALGSVPVTVSTAKGSVTADIGIAYLGPEVIGYIAGPEKMQAIGLIDTPSGLVVVWKKCEGGNGLYQYDLMDLSDPANPMLIASYTEVRDVADAGLIDQASVPWMMLNAGSMFAHIGICHSSTCNYAIYGGEWYSGNVIIGNVDIHGGITVCGDINPSIYDNWEEIPSDGEILQDDADGIWNSDSLAPPFPPIDDMPDILIPDETLLGEFIPQPKVLIDCPSADSNDPLNNGTPIIITDPFQPDFNKIPEVYIYPPKYPPYPDICLSNEEYSPMWKVREGNIAITTISDGKAQIADVMDWESPVLLSELEMPGALELTENYLSPDLHGGFAIWPSVNYQTKISSLRIADLSVPGSPLLGDVFYSSENRIWYANLAIEGRWAWMTYNLTPSIQEYPLKYNYLSLASWFNPLNPNIIGTIPVDGYSNDLVVHGRYVYGAQGSQGLMIVDTHR